LSKPIRAISCETTSAVNNSTLPLPGLSPVAGKSVVVKFDGGSLSSDGGVLALREVEQLTVLSDIGVSNGSHHLRNVLPRTPHAFTRNQTPPPSSSRSTSI